MIIFRQGAVSEIPYNEKLVQKEMREYREYEEDFAFEERYLEKNYRAHSFGTFYFVYLTITGIILLASKSWPSMFVTVLWIALNVSSIYYYFSITKSLRTCPGCGNSFSERSGVNPLTKWLACKPCQKKIEVPDQGFLLVKDNSDLLMRCSVDPNTQYKFGILNSSGAIFIVLFINVFANSLLPVKNFDIIRDWTSNHINLLLVILSPILIIGVIQSKSTKKRLNPQCNQCRNPMKYYWSKGSYKTLCAVCESCLIKVHSPYFKAKPSQNESLTEYRCNKQFSSSLLKSRTLRGAVFIIVRFGPLVSVAMAVYYLTPMFNNTLSSYLKVFGIFFSFLFKIILAVVLLTAFEVGRYLYRGISHRLDYQCVHCKTDLIKYKEPKSGQKYWACDRCRLKSLAYM